MKKFVNWLLNHLVLVLGVLTLVITLSVVGGVMLNSYSSYKTYERKFNEADLEIRSISPAQPNLIEFSDNYKSAYKNKLVLNAEDLNVETSSEDYLKDDYIDLTEAGGTVSANLSLEVKSFVDIDFVISSEYQTIVVEDDEEISEFGVKDLLNNVTFIVNNETMEEDEIDLINEGNGPEFHHLIMAGFALPEGDVTIEIKSNSGKNALMPQIQAINLFSSAVLYIAE